MNAPLPDLAASRPAVVTIDLHRGHLDPKVATMPLDPAVAERVTETNIGFLDVARQRRIPVVHVVTSYHGVPEIASNPWWASVADTDRTRANVLRHQLPDSPGLQLMPGLFDSSHDVTVYNKKRYDCFAATELDHVLRSLRIDTLLLTGVNTNSCVLATTVAANTRDYAPIVVEDCVDTMDRDMHAYALDIIRSAFGWVAKAEEVATAL